jgi:hypothetical protein
VIISFREEWLVLFDLYRTKSHPFCCNLYADYWSLCSLCCCDCSNSGTFLFLYVSLFKIGRYNSIPRLLLRKKRALIWILFQHQCTLAHYLSLEYWILRIKEIIVRLYCTGLAICFQVFHILRKLTKKSHLTSKLYAWTTIIRKLLGIIYFKFSLCYLIVDEPASTSNCPYSMANEHWKPVFRCKPGFINWFNFG